MAEAPHGAAKLVDAEVATPLGRVHAVRRTWDAPIDVSAVPERHWLELSLLPRSRAASGCFPAAWGPRRFEPIGALFLLPAGQPFRALSECTRQSSVVCALEPAAIRAWLDDRLDWTDGHLRAGLDIASPRLRHLLFHLGREIRDPGFGGDMLIELMIGQVAIELGRHVAGIEGRRTAGGLAPWRLRLIDDALAEDRPPSLALLAERCGLSARHLARGFRTPSSFSTAFRRSTGETPRDYRRRLRH